MNKKETKAVKTTAVKKEAVPQDPAKPAKVRKYKKVLRKAGTCLIDPSWVVESVDLSQDGFVSIIYHKEAK